MKRMGTGTFFSLARRGGLAAALLLSACNPLSSGSVPSSLEGSWRAAGDDGDGHSWFKEITFEGDDYSMQGYPPITATATVGEAVELGPRRWRLTLTGHVFHEQPAGDEEVVVELAEDGRSLELDGQTYRRTADD